MSHRKTLNLILIFSWESLSATVVSDRFRWAGFVVFIVKVFITTFFIQDQLKANALKEKKKDYEKLLKKQNMKDEEPPFNEFSSALDRFKQKR